MSISNVSNIAALRSTSGTASLVVFIEGYKSPGDGGGGNFYYVSTDTLSADNGATIIVGLNSSRFYRIWDQGKFNVLWAGADKTDNTSSDAAFANASAVSASLYVPTGRYLLNNSFTYNVGTGLKSFSIYGDGMDGSVLYFPSNNGLSINYSTAANSNTVVHIRDLSITAGEGGAGTALQLVFPSTSEIGTGLTDITNVKVRGDDGIGSYYWSNGIYVDGVSSVNFNGCVITSSANYGAAGNGIILQGNKEGSTVFNINLCVLDFLDTAIYYGGYIQGVTVANTNITNCTQGVVSGANETA